MHRKWFTLIEMTIVVVVIWVLAATLLPKLTSGMTKAENSWAIKDVRDIITALEMYKMDHGDTYPVSVSCNGTVKTDCTLSGVYTELSSYLKSIPKGNTKLPQWTIGNGNIVPAWNAYGYIGTGQRYILSYQFVDTRDGQRYKAVKMPDERRWMAENLNYKTANGECYDALDAKCANWFGKLYPLSDMIDICPPGWKLPTHQEWATMLNKIESLYGGVQNHGGAWTHLWTIAISYITANSDRFGFYLPYGWGKRSIFEYTGSVTWIRVANGLVLYHAGWDGWKVHFGNDSATNKYWVRCVQSS